MNNEIVKALGEVPALVETAKNLSKLIGEAMLERAKAEIPNEEIERVCSSIKKTVETTQCALPDTSKLESEIASGVSKELPDNLREAVKNTPVKLEHHHYHDTTWAMSEYAEKKTRRSYRLSFAINLALVLTLIGGVIWYHNQKSYWGEQYLEICRSGYITNAEREALGKDIFYVGILPGEYHKNPKLVREKIRRNQEVIRHREMEAQNNKGQFSAKTPIEQ